MHGLAFSLHGAKSLTSQIYGNYNYALVTDMAYRGRANTLSYHLHPQPLVAQKQPAVYLPIMPTASSLARILWSSMYHIWTSVCIIYHYPTPQDRPDSSQIAELPPHLSNGVGLLSFFCSLSFVQYMFIMHDHADRAISLSPTSPTTHPYLLEYATPVNPAKKSHD